MASHALRGGNAVLILLLAFATSFAAVPTAADAATPTAGTIVPRGTPPPPPPQTAAGARSTDGACPAARTPSAGFHDTATSIFAHQIDCLSWYEVTRGTSPGRFAPDGTVTRRQMAVFLHRWLERTVWLPAWDGVNRFPDLAGNGVAQINVLASAQIEPLLGRTIVSGFSDGTFRPDEPVSRQQMATFLSRVLLGATRYHDATLQRPHERCTFADSERISAAHRPNAELLCDVGVAAGRANGSFAPTATVTRGQMAAFLMRSQDLFVDAGLSFAPDEVVELVIDQHACASQGADGSPERAFCAIQDALDAVAAAPAGTYSVLFLRTSASWPAHDYGYEEDLVVPDRDLAIVADESYPSTVHIYGSMSVTGGLQHAVHLEGLVINTAQSGDPRPALDVPNGAFVGTFGAGVIGDEIGVSLEEGALLLAPNSMFGGGDVAVDVVDGVALISEGTIAFSGVGIDVWPESYVEVLDTQFAHTEIGIDLWEADSVVEGNWFYATELAHIVDPYGLYDLAALARVNTFTRTGATTAPYARVGTFEGAPALLPAR
jgi:hypothetical protein